MLFNPLKIKNLTLKNRAVMPPMCMYSADNNGYANDFHILHYGVRALGGISLIIQEATAITPDGRISVNDLGIWSDDHLPGLKKIVDAVHQYGSYAGIQINHAGRKARVPQPIGPSALAFSNYQVPKEMHQTDINEVIYAFESAAKRANQAGYDFLEIHAAHGYLISSFLSPLSNQRDDQYQHGLFFLKQILDAVSNVWPKEKALGIRISASDYHPNGLTPKDFVAMLLELKEIYPIDIINVSSGGVEVVNIKTYPGYQLEFAQEIKEKTDIITLGGGLIDDLVFANEALLQGKADLIYFGRALLREPFLLLNDAAKLNYDIEWPKPYVRGKK